MKKILKTIFSSTAIIAVMTISGVISAQEKNTIEEIRLSNQDGFSELRNLLVSNFDFTNPNLTSGTVNSTVEFSVAENGKITNVHASGECKYVSEELEDVMKSLLLKVDRSTLADNSMATVYVLPVSVTVSDR